MSEKFEGSDMRKSKYEEASWIGFVFNILASFIIDIGTLLPIEVIKAIGVALAWNTALISIFGVKMIHVRQTLMLFFTIDMCKIGSVLWVTTMRKRFENYTFRIIYEEEKSKIISTLFTTVIFMLYVGLGTKFTMHTWNSIIPLLNIQIVNIDIWQAKGVFVLLWLINLKSPKCSKERNKAFKEIWNQ